jgi:hypothetical protein
MPNVGIAEHNVSLMLHSGVILTTQEEGSAQPRIRVIHSTVIPY